MKLCLFDSQCLLHPICILTWKYGIICGTLCVFKSLYFCPYTLFRMCTCISTSIYVHLTYHVCSTHYTLLHGNMGSSLRHCVCCSHSTSVPTPQLECVYASVHVFLSTWLQMSLEISMHSYVETWVTMYGLCLFPGHLISVPIPCLECVYASVHLLMSVWVLNSAPSLHRCMETWVHMCVTVWVS